MPKVSKNLLPPETKNEITTFLVTTLTRIDDTDFLRRFINDLLTSTERLMLAKRLMAAVLLLKGYDYIVICRILKISKSTVNLLRRDLERGGDGYRRVFEKFFTQSKIERFLNLISRSVSALNLPTKGSPSSIKRWKKALHELV